MDKNYNPNFIEEFTIDKDICKDIIDFFCTNNSLHQPGASGESVDLSKKNSIDLSVDPKNLNLTGYECFKKYFNQLNECYRKYKIKWPFLKESFPEVDIGSFNIQQYKEGGHFSKIHSERIALQNLHRLFAFMTYLNDDFEGGCTYFSNFNLKIKPEPGKTLIWPADWTHAHKGEVVSYGSKYIITGWLNIPLPTN